MTHYFYLKIDHMVYKTLQNVAPVLYWCLGADHHTSSPFNWDLDLLGNGKGRWRDKDMGLGASLVVQWLRICLPMQETRVRALVWEDPTCRTANGPVSHNY